jgi:hypothetical protein
MSQEPNAKPKRRLFRFSLRTLLLLVTLTSIGLGWVTLQMRQAQRQRDAIAHFKDLTFTSCYDDVGKSMGCGEGYRFITEPRQTSLRDWVAKQFGKDYAYRLDHLHLASNQRVDDQHLARLPDLAGLRSLSIYCDHVTDRGLTYVAQLADLEFLSLEHASLLTDNGIAQLRQLKKLRVLRIYRAELTDSGLGPLTELDDLRFLMLGDTQVTDTGITQIRALSKLEMLGLSGPTFMNIGPGLSELEQALPNMKIARFKPGQW